MALESELSFHFHDFDAFVRPVVERAFLHLKRSLVVDKDLQRRWADACGKDEPACEQLGAVHLLLHGIYAFKANAEGGRTDLILGNTVRATEELRRSVIGLVLTEWKRASSAKKAKEKFEQAREQASRYDEGIMAGFELQRYRYLVVVSEKDCSIPNDIYQGNVIYRHINIPISPDTPSKAKLKYANRR